MMSWGDACYGAEVSRMQGTERWDALCMGWVRQRLQEGRENHGLSRRKCSRRGKSKSECGEVRGLAGAPQWARRRGWRKISREARAGWVGPHEGLRCPTGSETLLDFVFNFSFSLITGSLTRLALSRRSENSVCCLHRFNWERVSAVLGDV